MKNLTTRKGVYYARVTVDGRERWRSLDTYDRREAERRLRKMIEQLRGGTAPTMKGTATTIGDVLTAYEAAASMRRLAMGKPAESTVRQYTWSLTHVVAMAMNHEEAKTLPVSCLTDRMAADFVAAMMSGYGPSAEEQARGRSAAAHCLRNAKAIFASWATKAMNLTLPDLTSFLRYEATPQRKKYELPPAAIRQAIDEGAKRLRHVAPDIWLAFCLQRAAGLRANEAAHAQWDWLVTEDGITSIRVPETISKNRKRRTVPLHPDTAAAIVAMRRHDDPFILPGGHPTNRRNLVIRELARWLRSVGLSADRWPKAGHELRKLAGADWYTEHGIEVCAHWLGDTMQVAWQYYSDLTRQPKPLKMVG